MRTQGVDRFKDLIRRISPGNSDQPIWWDALSLVIVLMVGMSATAYLSVPPSRTNGTPKVSRILQAVGSGDLRGDSPTKGLAVAPEKAAQARTKNFQNISFNATRGVRKPIGWMKIPAVGLKVKYYEGVFDGVVKLGPGHWPGTPLPGGAGNSVFAGHRTTHTAPFADLDVLSHGDKITTKLGGRGRTTYRVFRTAVVPESEYVDFVLKQPKNKRARMLTLLACTPKGFRTHRIVVQALATKAPKR